MLIFPPLFIVGSTGVGKSDLSLKLASIYGAQIVNCDSMQQYKGMDIGTAKVSAAKREQIPHHLIDNLSVTETATLNDYLDLSRKIINNLIKDQIFTIVVGGSMMYYQALIDNWEVPATNYDLRKQLELVAKEKGLQYLYAELKSLDEAAAAKILPSDSRRIIRALEVVKITGEPYKANQPAITNKTSWGARVVGLSRDMEILDRNLEVRTEKMFATGLVEEVESLINMGLLSGTTAKKAIGYSQVINYLSGKMSLAEAEKNTLQATKRYVRRQRSWFKRDPRINWINVDENNVLESVQNIIER